MIDGTDAVLERFAGPAWKEWETAWRAGEMSSRECLSRQVKLIQASREELTRFAETLPIDKGIFELNRRSLERGIPFIIVSDGLDIIVQTVLRRHRLQHLPVFANRLIWKRDGQPALEFPYAARQCPPAAGTCKCKLTAPARDAGSYCVYVGDGQSDFCVSKKMDAVYAKGKLRKWCQSQKIACRPYKTLFEVADALFPQETKVQ